MSIHACGHESMCMEHTLAMHDSGLNSIPLLAHCNADACDCLSTPYCQANVHDTTERVNGNTLLHRAAGQVPKAVPMLLEIDGFVCVSECVSVCVSECADVFVCASV